MGPPLTAEEGRLAEEGLAAIERGEVVEGSVVSVAHLARVPAERMSEAKPADDAAATAWLDLTITPSGWELSHEGARVEDLAFDHRDVLTAAVARLRAAK